MNIKSKTGHIISNFHRRRERFTFFVKKDEFKNSEIAQIDNVLKDVNEGCHDKFLHSFK